MTAILSQRARFSPAVRALISGRSFHAFRDPDRASPRPLRGRLIVAGYHQDGPRTVNMQLWNLGRNERFDPAIERSVRVSEVVDAIYRRD